MVVPWVNKNIMVEHLKQISAVTEKARHAVVIMDGEGWHTNDIAEPFDNVSIIKLPPYSPEPNPIEQVWSWLRQHHLANPSFSDYEDIVSKVCRAWNGFLECSARVRQMCSIRWIDLTSECSKLVHNRCLTQIPSSSQTSEMKKACKLLCRLSM
ncbi:transposase [Vibrio vulnificus]|nr:transposase [Vibrio vulnificus]